MIGVPGSNLLSDAFSVINTASVTYYPYSSRALNDFRQWVTTYGAPKLVQASVQAVPRNKYEALGLDFNKTYVTFFTPNDTNDLDRDSSGDQFDFGNNRYQIESETDWFVEDGWTESLAVRIIKGAP